MTTWKNTFILLIAVLTITACNSGNKNTNTDSKEQVNLAEILKAANAISPEVSSVKDVFKTLELADAAYYPVLCNDPYNASGYLENKVVAAANLGVYVTDIVYHMYGDANDDMFLAFSASQELARYMGLESEFAATLLTELEGGTISRDSLITVFSDLMSQSESYNSGEELLHVHTAFLSGLYIEKLFITASLLEQSRKKEELIDDDLTNFKKLLVVFNKQLGTFSSLSSSIENHKKQLKEVLDPASIKQLEAAAKVLEEATDEVLNASEIGDFSALSTIYERIASIRTGIVSSS